MNEIDTLASFNSDVAPPTAEVFCRSRNALRSVTVRPERRGRRIALTAATAAVTTAGVVAAATIGIGSHTSIASAAEVLSKAATAAANDPAAAPRNSQYTYVKTEVPAAPGHPHQIMMETWRRVDGQGQDLVRITDKSPGRPAIASTGSSCLVPVPRGKACPPQPPIYRASYRYLASLPTDPDALLKVVYRQVDELDQIMHARGGKTADRAVQAFGTISGVMTSTVLPPKVAAAFIKAAAKLPGAKLIANASDVLGRNGVGVSMPRPANSVNVDGNLHPGITEMIFSKTSGTLLSDERRAVLRSTIVDKIGDRR